jgi:uncharacterized protein YkwD
MTIRGSVLRVALLAVATLLPASLLSAPADSAASPQTTYANQAFTATNNNRAARNLPKLSPSSCLKQFAAKQAQKMADQSRLFHQPLAPIANRCHLRAAGENVAYGFPNGSAVVRAWMNSPPHRANILNRNYRQMAIAARQNSKGAWYVAQVFGRRL